jgi:thioredoxin 1
MAILHIRSESEFNQSVLLASGPVLVEFEAEWCGPCRQMARPLEEIARENAGRLTVTTVNIDRVPDMAQKYGVRGIPTFILFNNGQAISTKVGSLPKSNLVKWLSIIGATP